MTSGNIMQNISDQRSNIIESLRAARNVNDSVSKLRENSWENTRLKLLNIVESPNWKYGPAELIATFDKHIVCKAPSGNLIQVEWELDTNSNIQFKNTTVYETTTPVSDLGRELMETAKAAVELIINKDYTAASPMIESIAAALDSKGELSRRVAIEINLRALNRSSWWHKVVESSLESEEVSASISEIPETNIESEEFITKSVNDLLCFLKNKVAETSNSLRKLYNVEHAKYVESFAVELASDLHRSTNLLMQINNKNLDETIAIYETIVTQVPKLVMGVKLLNKLADE